MTKYDLKNKLRLQLSDDMREFAILNNLTEQDIIKIRDDNLIPQPHLGYLTALLKDKNFEFYKEDKWLTTELKNLKIICLNGFKT